MFTNIRIGEDVRTALRREARIKHLELIACRSIRSAPSSLRGAVGTLPERLAAGHDGRDVEGRFPVVIDDLKVHRPVGRRCADDEIRAAALQWLIWDARIRSTHPHVKVAHGHLTLTGYVREEAEIDAAAEDVPTETGLVGVANRIEIR